MIVESVAISLGQWIDTETGEFHNWLGEDSREDCADYLRQKIWEEFQGLQFNLFGNNKNPIDKPLCDELAVKIKFSDKIIRTTKQVRPGIGVEGSDIRFREYNYLYPEEKDEIPSREDKSIVVEELMLGEFRRSSSKKNIIAGTIILYTKAIAVFSDSNHLDYSTVFWSTLMHEAFHAFHFSLLQKIGRQDRWDKKSEKKSRDIVKESLAAKFEFNSLCKNGRKSLAGIAMLDHLNNTWRKYDIEDWPYSGAIGIEEEELLCRLIKLSLYDWKTAADIIRTGYYLADPEIKSMFQLVKDPSIKKNYYLD